MTKGLFITVEGIEGAGKSTAMQCIQAYLSDLKLDVLLTREPGGTIIAEEIRQVLLHSNAAETMQAKTELLLMFASRAQHIHTCIAPALLAGQCVVSDRYIDASYAYQGGGRGIDIQFIEMLDRAIVGSVYPNLTLLLDLTPELGFARAKNRGTERDRIEREKIDFFERVRKVYLQRAEFDPHRIKMIDASLPLETVQSQIRYVLTQWISNGQNSHA